MIERVQWSVESLHYLKSMESLHFTEDETSEYRRQLMHEIEHKIILLGTSMPSKEDQYFGTYRVVIGPHKVYYSLDSRGTLAYRGCSKRGQNSPAHCYVSAKNTPSRTQNVRAGFAGLNGPRRGPDPVRILGWLPCTAWV